MKTRPSPAPNARAIQAPSTPEPCFECGRPATNQHHVVPKARGGTKCIPLCVECHGKAHDADLLTLQRENQRWRERAQAEGRRIGRKPKAITPEQLARIQGLPIQRAAAALKMSPHTLKRHAQEWGFTRGPDGRGNSGPRRRAAPGKGQGKFW